MLAFETSRLFPGTFGDRLWSAEALDCIGGNIVKSTRQLDSRKSNDPPNNRTAL